MIDIIKQTPPEYSNQSRDYQVISRLYTALFNLSKCYTDSLSIWNRDIDNKLSTLRSRTLNFIPEHNWNENDMEAVTSCFKYLVINKGTEAALKYCISILMKIKNINGEINEDTVIIKNNELIIRLEKGITTWGILEDLMKYILPIGLTYRIIEYKSQQADGIRTNIKVRWLVDTESSHTSGKMLIGDDSVDSSGKQSKDRIITNTYIYSDSEGREIVEE